MSADTHTCSHSFQPQIGGRDVSEPWKDGIIKGACIPTTRTILPRCLRVWAAACLSASWTEHNTRVRRCVGARALVRRCACHVSASAATDTQPHLFPKLIIFPSCRASQWCHNVSGKRKKKKVGERGKKGEKEAERWGRLQWNNNLQGTHSVL